MRKRSSQFGSASYRQKWGFMLGIATVMHSKSPAPKYSDVDAQSFDLMTSSRSGEELKKWTMAIY